MNKVILIGRLTRDPELRATEGGVNVARFSVAVNRNFKDKNTGNYEADFINCVAFRQQADFISKYFSKGSQILIEGNIRTGKYEADGVTKYTTDVSVERVEFVGSKKDNEQANSNPFGQTEPAKPAAETNVSGNDPFKDFGSEVVLTDDDLPF